MTFNQIKDFNVTYEYNDNINEIANINNYLENLFLLKKVNITEIYNKNKIKNESNLESGLYRKVTVNNYSSLINDILNIYLNLTGNPPLINTLLICNEDTNIEKIKAFLYRAFFCEESILFVIANIECLELSITQSLIKTLKMLYTKKNKNINSYLLFMYEKKSTGLTRDIEKLIPEKNILADKYKEKQKKINNIFDNIELYSSKFSGYGKTTEIKSKIKEKGGKYYYLPIGGSFTRSYLINNLENLKLDLVEGNKLYLHIDLSEMENDDLMNEILFKLLIQKYFDSKKKIFYLGNDINIFIEVPNCSIDFEEKYKILKIFNKTYIDKLCPLRLEENVKKIEDSPISIVAEILELYKNGKIATENV